MLDHRNTLSILTNLRGKSSTRKQPLKGNIREQLSLLSTRACNGEKVLCKTLQTHLTLHLCASHLSSSLCSQSLHHLFVSIYKISRVPEGVEIEKLLSGSFISPSLPPLIDCFHLPHLLLASILWKEIWLTPPALQFVALHLHVTAQRSACHPYPVAVSCRTNSHPVSRFLLHSSGPKRAPEAPQFVLHV